MGLWAPGPGGAHPPCRRLWLVWTSGKLRLCPGPGCLRANRGKPHCCSPLSLGADAEQLRETGAALRHSPSSDPNPAWTQLSPDRAPEEQLERLPPAPHFSSPNSFLISSPFPISTSAQTPMAQASASPSSHLMGSEISLSPSLPKSRNTSAHDLTQIRG